MMLPPFPWAAPVKCILGSALWSACQEHITLCKGGMSAWAWMENRTTIFQRSRVSGLGITLFSSQLPMGWQTNICGRHGWMWIVSKHLWQNRRLRQICSLHLLPRQHFLSFHVFLHFVVPVHVQQWNSDVVSFHDWSESIIGSTWHGIPGHILLTWYSDKLPDSFAWVHRNCTRNMCNRQINHIWLEMAHSD